MQNKGFIKDALEIAMRQLNVELSNRGTGEIADVHGCAGHRQSGHQWIISRL